MVVVKTTSLPSRYDADQVRLTPLFGCTNLGIHSGTTRGAKRASPNPLAKSLKKFNPQMQAFKRALDLTCK